MEQYEIQDNNGVIHSFSDKHEADSAWDAMILLPRELDKIYGVDKSMELIKQYALSKPWLGDLKLVQVHRIHK